MLVLNFPIEPMELRYSIQWDKWFREAFVRNDIPFITMNGHTLQTGIKNDQFLDPIKSFKYKFSQLEQAMNIINYRYKEEIVIFLQDAWFPGTEAFAYVRDLVEDSGYHKVCGFLHGGSYLPKDITHGKTWAPYAEESFLGHMSKVFVGSQYHKDMLAEGHPKFFTEDCVTVTGCPVDCPGESTTDYWGKVVVWPHRISKDKRPDIFDKLAAEPRFKNIQFKKSLEECKTKGEYHNLLAHSDIAVSTAEHETFGISMVEAAIHGLHILVPNDLCYPEIFKKENLYSSYEELVDKVEHLLTVRRPGWNHTMAERFSPIRITDKICQEIKGLF